MKNRLLRSSLLPLCVLALSANLAAAQATPTPAPQPATPGQRRGPRPNPTNLKVLPKTLTGDDTVKIMHQFEGDLGVECEFCHARNPQTNRNDFASDVNPVKDKARLMIKMTEEINAGYLAQLNDHKSTDAVTCATCHRGMSHPEAFVPKPQERGNRPPGAPPQSSATPQ
jgi:hypothetical protein